eukprot:g14233.t1
MLQMSMSMIASSFSSQLAAFFRRHEHRLRAAGGGAREAGRSAEALVRCLFARLVEQLTTLRRRLAAPTTSTTDFLLRRVLPSLFTGCLFYRFFYLPYLQFAIVGVLDDFRPSKQNPEEFEVFNCMAGPGGKWHLPFGYLPSGPVINCRAFGEDWMLVRKRGGKGIPLTPLRRQRADSLHVVSRWCPHASADLADGDIEELVVRRRKNQSAGEQGGSEPLLRPSGTSIGDVPILVPLGRSRGFPPGSASGEDVGQAEAPSSSDYIFEVESGVCIWDASFRQPPKCRSLKTCAATILFGKWIVLYAPRGPAGGGGSWGTIGGRGGGRGGAASGGRRRGLGGGGGAGNPASNVDVRRQEDADAIQMELVARAMRKM